MDINPTGYGGNDDRRYYYTPQAMSAEVDEQAAPEEPPPMSWWDKLKALKGKVDEKVQGFIYPRFYQELRRQAGNAGVEMRYRADLNEALSRPEGMDPVEHQRILDRRNLYRKGAAGEQ